MSRFFGKLCPVCRSPFGENDDIVVCPDCGTPHHRACYIRLGECALSQHHESGFEWNGRLPDEQTEPQQNTQPPHDSHQQSLFGDEQQPYNTQYSAPAAENTDPHHAEYPGGANTTESDQYEDQNIPPFGAPFGEHNGEPYTNPYVEAYKQMQKLTSDETRGEDGVSSKELSRFVGTSVFHYAQAFSTFRVGVMQYGGVKKVKTSFNIWAGLLSPIHQIYRRMDALGILILIVQAIMSIPQIVLYRFQSMLTQPTISTLQNLSLISNVANIAIMIALTVFGDYLYYKFCVRRIKRIRAQYDDGKAEGYYEALTANGAPSKLRAVIGILATLFVGQLVAVLPLHQFFS